MPKTLNPYRSLSVSDLRRFEAMRRATAGGPSDNDFGELIALLATPYAEDVPRERARLTRRGIAGPEGIERAGGPVDPAGIGYTKAIADLETEFTRQRVARAFPVTPEERAKQQATAEQFGRRREVMPVVRGVRALAAPAAETRFGRAVPRIGGIYRMGEPTVRRELREEGEVTTSPEFAESMRAGRAQLFAGQGASPGVTQALIQQETGRERIAARSADAEADRQFRAGQSAAARAGASADQATRIGATMAAQVLRGAIQAFQAETQARAAAPPGWFGGRQLTADDEARIAELHQALEEFESLARSSGGAVPTAAPPGGTDDLSSLSDDELLRLLGR
jgi:hypothetical protein